MRDISNETKPPTYTKEGIKNFSEDTETSQEGNEWIFRVNLRSISKDYYKIELF